MHKSQKLKVRTVFKGHLGIWSYMKPTTCMSYQIKSF